MRAVADILDWLRPSGWHIIGVPDSDRLTSMLNTPASKQPDTQHHKKLNVGFLLANNFTLNALALFVDALRLAGDERDFSRRRDCDWSILGNPSQPVRSSCGISIAPDRRYVDAGEFDYVAVIGGTMHTEPTAGPELIGFLRHAAKSGVPLIGHCTGSFILARAGLLKGRRACISWLHIDEFEAEFPSVEAASDTIFIIDRDRITCPGGASTLHLAAHLIERHVGPAEAEKVRRIMIVDKELTANAPQPPPQLSAKAKSRLVQKAILLMERHLNSPLPVTEVARLVNTGPRQLDRSFRKEVGTSPANFCRLLRLQRGRELILKGDRPITAIALECGFTDGAHFSRWFREAYGLSPSAFRRVQDSQSPAPAYAPQTS